MSTLKSKKKSELQAIAVELGIDTDGHKANLEARILSYLSEHIHLRNDPRFNKYFAAITGSDSPGPFITVVQGRRRAGVAKKDPEEKLTNAIIRFGTFCLLAYAARSDEDNTSGPEVLKKGKRRSSVVIKDIADAVPGPPSPSRVSTQIEHATRQLVRRARSASSSLHLDKVAVRVPIVRKAISNVVSVDLIASLTELLLLFNKLIPRSYPVPLPHPYSLT
jgi:SAP domain-containing new25